ncbi:MAG: polyphenol oxidase family protein [Acidobacteria bacterium]|nr:polyphenol oxidase family protein [Acidobacteriota bacterium]
MFNKFQGPIKEGKFGKFIDLSPLFPKSVNAFFLVDKNMKKTKEEVKIFLQEKNIEVVRVCRLRQIHSARIVNEEDDVEADGIWTMSQGTAITIAVADCVPILISADNGNVLIALHSGWKGTFYQIAKKSAVLFQPEKCDAVWIGPSIRHCCYKVPIERVENFKDEFPQSKGVYAAESKLDLPLINAEILRAVGIPQEKIYLDERCTYCDKTGFASYRRDKENAGRMLLVAVKN